MKALSLILLLFQLNSSIVGDSENFTKSNSIFLLKNNMESNMEFPHPLKFKAANLNLST